MANHCTYLDIPILGSVQSCCFVAKDAVARWPIVGAVAKVLGCVFVSRRPSQVAQDLRAIIGALQAGRRIVMFPEGTTSDGCRLLPLKSSYFQLPGGTLVHPIGLRYHTIGGLPLRHAVRKLYSWRGSASLMSHLWWLVGLPPVVVQLIAAEPLIAADDRKALALACQDALRRVMPP